MDTSKEKYCTYYTLCYGAYLKEATKRGILNDTQLAKVIEESPSLVNRQLNKIRAPKLYGNPSNLKLLQKISNILDVELIPTKNAPSKVCYLDTDREELFEKGKALGLLTTHELSRHCKYSHKTFVYHLNASLNGRTPSRKFLWTIFKYFKVEPRVIVR